MTKNKTKSRRLKHRIQQNVWFSLFLLIVLITSCKISGKEEKSSSKQTSEGNIESNGDTDYNSVKSVVQNWNKTHQDYNFTTMQKIYTDKVLYYGKEMTNKEIILAKQSFIKKNNDFTQSILGDLTIENIGESRMKVSFIKKASFAGKRNEYPSYLELKKTDSEWKICTESDNITDKNLAKGRENTSSSTVETINRAYIKNNNVFVEFADNKEKQLTYNGKDREPIIIDANTIFFIRKQFDIEDNEVNVLMTVEIDMLKERIIKTLDSDITFENPKISNDKKHIFYTTNLYATGDGVVKLNITTGESEDLLEGSWYHEINSGDFKGYFLNYTFGFKDGQIGRQFFYELRDSEGRPYKTFEDEAAMYDFAKANNINIPGENYSSNESSNTENRNETGNTVSHDQSSKSISANGQETLGINISKIKVYNYDKTELLSTATISGGWSTRGDKIRIDYGFLNNNKSIVELQILDYYEISGEMKMECKDTGSGEKIIAYIKDDPINRGKPILEVRIKSSQQTLQFLYN